MCGLDSPHRALHLSGRIGPSLDGNEYHSRRDQHPP
jgi:hypothetical protein